MTPRQCLAAALEGQTPDITPFSIYAWMMDDPQSPRWRRMREMGLIPLVHPAVFRTIEHGVENGCEERRDGADLFTIYTKKTPVGTLRMLRRNGWHHEDWIKTPDDYRIMRWIVEHSEVQSNYQAWQEAEAAAEDDTFLVSSASRTPLMSINVDWAGTEQFCMDLALEVPELYDLFIARKAKFLEEVHVIAAGPGRFVKFWENLTISMLGPRYYEEFLLSVYDEAMPILEAGGKRAMVHYDGALSPIVTQIARAPFHIIESLTEPPEGDMTYDQCRAAWPDKAFWGNLNIECYALPDDTLREAVIAKRQRAGKRGFAFEVSEDLPAQWETAFPVVLRTLTELG